MSNGSMAIMQIANLKSTIANNTALDAAEEQRELIEKQRDLRAAQQTFERLVDDGHFSADDARSVNALEGTTGIELDGNTGGVIAYGSQLGHIEAQGKDPKNNEINRAKKVKSHVDNIRKAFDSALKDLEAEDRLGNHEIQRLMQIMNQNDTLQANVAKKDDDRANAIIGKI